MAMALIMVWMTFAEFRDGVLDGGEAFDNARITDLTLSCGVVEGIRFAGMFDVTLVDVAMERFEHRNGLLNPFRGEWVLMTG